MGNIGIGLGGGYPETRADARPCLYCGVDTQHYFILYVMPSPQTKYIPQSIETPPLKSKILPNHPINHYIISHPSSQVINTLPSIQYNPQRYKRYPSKISKIFLTPSFSHSFYLPFHYILYSL